MNYLHTLAFTPCFEGEHNLLLVEIRFFYIKQCYLYPNHKNTTPQRINISPHIPMRTL